MTYQSRIREIQSAFVMGFQDRETCISMFETLLHEYGLLPKEDLLDRTITNENFLALLKMAREHRNVADTTTPDHSDPNLKKLEDLRKAEENLKKLTRWMEQMAGRATADHFKIADSVNRNCPVCQKPTNGLFNRVQSIDNHVIPIDPPRCQECMMKWVEDKFGGLNNIKSEAPVVTVDRSPASPMKPDETDFFAEYEKQMGQS